MNQDKPFFSVVIPTCDRPHYLNEAITSALKQSCQPREIIVIDNGYEAVDYKSLPVSQMIRLVRALPRFGVSQARNLGAILSKGEYIAFLDDDDAWDIEYLENVRQAILTKGGEIILGRLRNMRNGTLLIGKQAEFSNNSELIRKILKRNPGAGGSNTTVKRLFFSATSGYDPWITTNQDKALVLDLLLSGGKATRAEAAWVDVREDGDGPRQTILKKRIQGKFRFTRKYWAHMNWTTRFFNLMQLGRLWLLSLFGSNR